MRVLLCGEALQDPDLSFTITIFSANDRSLLVVPRGDSAVVGLLNSHALV